MATTYVPVLPTQTLSSASATVTFSSIPATYTDLVLVMQPAASIDSQNVQIQFNGDTGANYSYVGLKGNGTTAGVTRGTSLTAINLADAIGTTTVLGGQIIVCNIMNYANTTTFKTVINKTVSNSGTYNGVELMTGLWRSTAAINQIVIKQGSTPTFSVGSTFTLYGVASAAVVSSVKATGGDIVATDGTYWYHAFRSSGTFTPTSTLTCDVLVVAGGGSSGGVHSGGSLGSGGGGAGGVFYAAAQSIAASAQTVTVGAGGAGVGTSAVGIQGNNSVFGSLTAAVGGGRGATYNGNGGSGGSGGGGSGNGAGQGGAGTAGQGNAGGGGDSSGAGSGGGGAGAIGSPNSNNSGGNGGAGVNTYSSWLGATGLGVSGFIAGGGGGGSYANLQVAGTGGSGGGGAGEGSNNTTPTNGTANTGGGGGGTHSNNPSKSGGSGLVIVRYAV